MTVIERDAGARRANDLIHRQRTDHQNDRIEAKLDEIIELLKRILAARG